MSVSTLNSELTAFSLRCKQPDSIITEGTGFVQQVFELLKRDSRSSIDRVFIFGSAGKKTAIANSDFDCVIFINNLSMNALVQNHVLYELTSLLLGIPNVRDVSEIESESIPGLQFIISGYDVDLLIAPNLVSRPDLSSDVAADQAVAAYDRMNSSNCASYNPALCESAVRFMKEQSGFVHDLVRLCKFWNQRINMPGKIKGRSTLIELIAVHAGQEVERTYSNNKMYDGFHKFLSLMVDFSVLRIRCSFDATKGRRNVHRPHFNAPFVVEPADPYANLAEKVNYQHQQTFVNKARETLRKLQQAQYSSVSINSVFS